MATHHLPVDRPGEQDLINLPVAEDALNTGILLSLRNFRRLVVVIPGQVMDQVQFSRAVRDLALPGQKTVRLVMLVHEVDAEFASQRQLATLASLVTDARIKVQTTFAWGKSWNKCLEKLVVAGDLVICPAETTIRRGFSQREGLAQVLRRSLAVPVYSLPGFFLESRSKALFNWRRLPVWVLIFAIFAAFFEFEAVSDLIDRGWPGQVLTIILLLVEFGFIYLWASLAG